MSDKKGNFHFTCQFLPPNERHRGGVGRTAIVGGHFQVKCSRPLDDSVHLRHEILLKNFQKNQFPFNSFMEQRSSKSEIQNIWNRIFLKIFGCHFCFFCAKFELISKLNDIKILKNHKIVYFIKNNFQNKIADFSQFLMIFSDYIFNFSTKWREIWTKFKIKSKKIFKKSRKICNTP